MGTPLTDRGQALFEMVIVQTMVSELRPGFAQYEPDSHDYRRCVEIAVHILGVVLSFYERAASEGGHVSPINADAVLLQDFSDHTAEIGQVVLAELGLTPATLAWLHELDAPDIYPPGPVIEKACDIVNCLLDKVRRIEQEAEGKPLILDV